MDLIFGDLAKTLNSFMKQIQKISITIFADLDTRK